MRKTYSREFKGKVALAAVKEAQTVSELAGEYAVHPTQIKKWKRHLTDHVGEVFEDQRRKKTKAQEELIEELYKQIGQLKVELDWMKKKAGYAGS